MIGTGTKSRLLQLQVSNYRGPETYPTLQIQKERLGIVTVRRIKLDQTILSRLRPSGVIKRGVLFSNYYVYRRNWNWTGKQFNRKIGGCKYLIGGWLPRDFKLQETKNYLLMAATVLDRWKLDKRNGLRLGTEIETVFRFGFCVFRWHAIWYECYAL